ncbi:2Fe-2S iron-sulfur cluster-binding protein [Myxococcus stipitatus]|uniref:2Fe-2S iron-sulfur cluster-binding protein n=1 Tax=Myxococcus stipitatus TaxID=83455 RepID=UPI001F1B1F52|nr:2Fe-2S iron-sulfur cluster-binding protein [Myxococcus stipitatus]MCE9670178.1 2Fe-2S iron-sulfur cluster-binding protein [Myxococcus stipitatus]
MRRLKDAPSRGRAITVNLEGESIPAVEGEPVACSLIAAGESMLARSVKYHRPRGPYCFAEACSHCLMRVDGLPNVYTCRTPAREGMKLERQNAFPSAKVDVFETIDWFFPHGLDHHEMFAGVPVVEKVMAKVARQLAGLGLLPKEPAPAPPPSRTLRTRVAVVGGGGAGLAAARVLTDRGVPFLLFERADHVGGRLANGAPESGAPAVEDVATLAPDSIHLRATVLGLYDDEHGRYLAVGAWEPDGPRLLKVYAERFLLAPGGHPPTIPFENNDLPGVYAGRAASLLLRRHDVAPQVAALVGWGPELYALAALMEDRGVKVSAVVDLRAAPPSGAHALTTQGSEPKAHGLHHVTAFSFATASGERRKVDCDAVLVSVPVSPSFELARQGGAEVGFDEARGLFRVVADADGRTKAADVFVAGDVTGGGTAKQAAEAGRRAAQALVGGLS